MLRTAHTLALIKPDAFRRQLVGAVITRIEHAPFDIISTRLMRLPHRPTIQRFYGLQHAGRDYFPALVDFMCSGPVLALILRREDNAIAAWREIMGPFDPGQRAGWTIRGHLAGDQSAQANLVHGSDSVESFIHEAQTLGWAPEMWA